MDELPEHAVAVYGTLRRGQRNHGLLGRSTFLGTARLHGALYDVPSGPHRPYAYPDLLPGGDQIMVELYQLDDLDLLATLDALERYDPGDEAHSQYVRRLVPVLASAVTRAWTYLYNGPPEHLGEPIPYGDWAVWQEHRPLTRDG